MEAIEELSQLSDAMRQAAGLLADEDIDETTSSSSSSKRPSTFLNVVALGNTVGSLIGYFFIRSFKDVDYWIWKFSFFLFDLQYLHFLYFWRLFLQYWVLICFNVYHD